MNSNALHQKRELTPDVLHPELVFEPPFLGISFSSHWREKKLPAQAVHYLSSQVHELNLLVDLPQDPFK